MIKDLMPAVLQQLSTSEVLFLACATMIGAVFRAYSGFGAGLFLVPTYSLFLPPARAIILVTLLNIPTTLQILPKIVGDVPWPRVIPVTASALVAIPAGVYLLTLVDGDVLRRVIGVLVVAFTVVLMSGWQYKGQHGLAKDTGVGLLTGLISGSTGMGGPPVVLYFLSGRGTVSAARAAFVASFFAITLITFGSFLVAGLVVTGDFWMFAGLLPIYSVGTWIGSRLHQRTRHMETLLRTTALTALLAIGMLASLS